MQKRLGNVTGVLEEISGVPSIYVTLSAITHEDNYKIFSHLIFSLNPNSKTNIQILKKDISTAIFIIPMHYMFT